MFFSPYIGFKTSRISTEWSAGFDPDDRVPLLHPALEVIVLTASLWYYRRTNEPAVITGLLRTREEQLAIYPNDPKMRSPHEFGRAADLRILDLDKKSRAEWERWLNQTFPYLGSPGCRTVMVHEVGSLGEHLHIQVGPLEPVPPNLTKEEHHA